MGWYKIEGRITARDVLIVVGLWGLFFGALWMMVAISGVAYRLCEVRYVIKGDIVIYEREEEFTEEALSRRLQRDFERTLIFTLRNHTNVAILFPEKILSQEDVEHLDTYLRTNFSHVTWIGPQVRKVPQLEPRRRFLVMAMLSFSMALGVIVALKLRRES
ncbi:MAG: hypothetical protein N2314_08175 [Brevinematales bacterium]|nr:hypothetical protein [Brevinematales bacterium]